MFVFPTPKGFTELVTIVVQNNALRTNNVKVRTDNMPRNSKYMLYNRDGIVNYLISE